MAQYQSGYPTQSPTEEYGNPVGRKESNPVGRKDEYGNPIQHTGVATGHGILGTGTGAGYGATGTGTGFTSGTEAGHGVTTLSRSGSSSSSEDDGYGGRRKKGVKEKIKEKLPGGAHKSDDPYSTAPTTAPYGGQQQERGGVMDKIKETIPGGQKQDPYSTGHNTSATPGYGVGGGHPENKGMMDQMKEKLPGGQQRQDPYTTTTGAQAHHGTTETGEKKGMMDKIKEKLPGGHSTTR